MAVWNLGSINIDNVYRVPHLPVAGETLAAGAFQRGLGGKGANMSVAAARCAARVHHIGAIGADGRWAKDRLLEYGVDTRFIADSSEPTGHANISVDDEGENQIILYTGANGTISGDQLGQALSSANQGDTFVTQNETNAQAEGAKIARDMGLRVVYAAAPFSVDAVQAMLPLTDLLILNEVECAQLETALAMPVVETGVPHIVVTLGAKGCRYHDVQAGQTSDIPAIQVDPIDTTGAGDTFSGYLVAGLDRGLPMAQSLSLATKAAALMVTRLGTADVIPDLKDIEDWRLG